MTPLENEKLVEIHPKHLKLMQFYLAQYFNMICEKAEEGENVQEINDLASLDFVIDTILGAHCNDPTRENKNESP
jgi:hypothetical protein